MMQRTLGVAALLVVAAAPAKAQVLGLPVYNPGVPSGIGIYGDVGFSNDNAGGGRTYGATGRAGFGPLGVTATIGKYDPSGTAGSRTVYGGTGNIRIFGGGLIPVSVTLQGGYGRINLGTTGASARQEHIPVGVGIAISIPSPVLTIKPWIAPRLDVTRNTVGTASQTDTKGAISGGVELNTLTGVGLQASYDLVRSNGLNAGIFGVGLHAGIKIPGL